MTDEIHELAEKHKDGYITEGSDVIGYEFALTSIEAFYRAAFNAGLEAGAQCADNYGTPGYADDLAAAIRTLKEQS